MVERNFGGLARFAAVQGLRALASGIGKVAFRDFSDAHARDCADVGLERFMNLFSNYWFY